MDVENKMVVDGYWPNEDELERESEWEKLCRKADEAYDGRFDDGKIDYDGRADAG